MLTYWLMTGEPRVFSALFPTELFIAELLYLFNLKRCKRFPLYFGIACAAYVLFVLFVPPYINNGFSLVDLTDIAVNLYSTFYCLMLVLVSVFVLLPCFDADKRNIVFCCTAGYCTQHITAMIAEVLCLGIPENLPLAGNAITLAAVAGSYTAFYFGLARKIKLEKHTNIGNTAILLFSVSSILVNIILSMFRRLEPIGTVTAIAEAAYSVICCLLTLGLQFNLFLRREQQYETDMIRHIWARDKADYATAKKYMDEINIKYHDLKHIVTVLKNGGLDDSYVEELEKVTKGYGEVYRTGNAALDVVLTEKSRLFGQYGIKFTCMVEGETLAFMDDVDIYSCVGNAVENAVRAVASLPEERRVISFSSRKEANMVCLHMENYYVGNVLISSGLPITTKSDKRNHGFGVKSMKMIAEKYGGHLVFSAADGIFSLDVFFPTVSLQAAKQVE